MDRTIYVPRITCPIPYGTDTGHYQSIPVGPCLIESTDKNSMDVVWGTDGQVFVTLSAKEIEAAQQHGQIVLLDCRTGSGGSPRGSCGSSGSGH